MKKGLLEKITTLSYISLATIPLLKENFNSLLIILCVLLTLANVIITKNKKPFKKEYWALTLIFFLFLLRETLSLDFNYNRVLKYLPFLIFPVLFYYRPVYINEKVKKDAIKVFQTSVILQCFIYLFVFLINNPLSKLFYVSPENIPFFREYVFSNYLFKIHPTYFSAFLLVSFTISMFHLLYWKKKIDFFNILNVVLTLLFIFLFSSKMILLIAIMTIIALLVKVFSRKNLKHSMVAFSGLFLLLIVLMYPSKEILKERFDEIRTEINKPIVGNYYNSTNTRIAILKCSFILLKKVPFFGYGDQLQDELNNCYAQTNNSNFYKLHVFNTHNYYLNLILYGGWLFLILFLFYIINVFKHLKYSTLGIFLLIQFLLLNLTENFFSRHYGMVLFNYFICLFIFIRGSIKN